MREIKFRGFDNKKKFQYGSYYYGCLYPNSFKSHYINDVIIDEKTLGQYTGLKDKNEKEIYEGDIVKHDYKFGNGFGVVAYYAPLFKLDSKKGTCEDFTWEDWEQFEVIGNMYENPELLK